MYDYETDRLLKKAAAERMAKEIMAPHMKKSEDTLFWLLSLQVAHQNGDVIAGREAIDKLLELGVSVVRAAKRNPRPPAMPTKTNATQMNAALNE